MHASSRRRWIRRAFVLSVAVWTCGGPGQGIAATGVLFPAANSYHRRNYDPFEEPASQVQAPKAIAAPVEATPAKVEVVLRSDFHEPPTATPDPFDAPCERLPMVTESTRTRVFQAAGTTQSTEPIPAPSNEYQYEDQEEAAGAIWSATPVNALTTDIVLPGGLLPKDHWSERPQQFAACGDACCTTRGWPASTFTWVASCLCHNPLYFEEINLERYGYGCGCYGPCCSNCLQSAVSACHFFGTMPMLPWKMAVDCPGECDYTLGYYRPGSCPPWRYNCCTRCSGAGTLAESGAVVGLIFLIP